MKEPRPTTMWRACLSLRLVRPAPNFVANLSRDQAVADMKVMDEAHLDLGADRIRAILERIAGDLEACVGIVEHPVRSRKTLYGRKFKIDNAVEHAKIHFLDQIAALIRHLERR